MKLKNWHLTIAIIAAICSVAVTGGFIAFRYSTTATSVLFPGYFPDWPPFTMTYQIPVLSDNQPDTRVFRLDYESKRHWKEEVIKDALITTKWGTFSQVGSYREWRDNQLITFDASSGRSDIEQISDGEEWPTPVGSFEPVPLAMLERGMSRELVRTRTEARVCFNERCYDQADGWVLSSSAGELIYADDERGFPLKVLDTVVIELMVSSNQQPVSR